MLFCTCRNHQPVRGGRGDFRFGCDLPVRNAEISHPLRTIRWVSCLAGFFVTIDTIDHSGCWAPARPSDLCAQCDRWRISRSRSYVLFSPDTMEDYFRSMVETSCVRSGLWPYASSFHPPFCADGAAAGQIQHGDASQYVSFSRSPNGYARSDVCSFLLALYSGTSVCGVETHTQSRRAGGYEYPRHNVRLRDVRAVLRATYVKCCVLDRDGDRSAFDRMSRGRVGMEAAKCAVCSQSFSRITTIAAPARAAKTYSSRRGGTARVTKAIQC